VRLRPFQDDSNLEDIIRVVLIGERNHEDSRRKAQATTVGIQRAAERGDWTGGILSEGYRLEARLDAHGRS
jgi:hypothetical protein